MVFSWEIKEISFFTNTKKWSEINEGTLKISLFSECSTPTPKKTCLNHQEAVANILTMKQFDRQALSINSLHLHENNESFGHFQKHNEGG